MWELYDELINEVPLGVYTERVCVGANVTVVQSDGVAGVSETVVDERRPRQGGYELCGKPLREVAALIRSWNFTEASIGLAALSCWYNRGTEGAVSRFPFRFLRGKCENARVAMTRDIPYLTGVVRPVAQLSIFETEPSVGSYPAAAGETLLSVQEVVILGGDAITDKTLPRLLELSRGAGSVVMAGFLPLAPALMRHGVLELDAACASNAAECFALAESGASASQLLKICSVRRMGAGI